MYLFIYPLIYHLLPTSKSTHTLLGYFFLFHQFVYILSIFIYTLIFHSLICQSIHQTIIFYLYSKSSNTLLGIFFNILYPFCPFYPYFQLSFTYPSIYHLPPASKSIHSLLVFLSISSFCIDFVTFYLLFIFHSLSYPSIHSSIHF